MTSIVFTGDIGFDKYMDHKWEDEELVSDEVLDFLKSGDHLVINVEGPLSKPEKIINKSGVAQLIHSMDPVCVDFFDKIGADIYNINNNHIMDAGEKGINDTLELARKRGVKTIGAGRNMEEASEPLFLKEAGGIGILSVGYDRACRKATDNTPGCLNFSDMDIIKKRIAEIKEKCRYCIIVAHDGEEFTCLPSPYTRDRFLEYLDAGADIIVAHHPHVPMNYEIVNSNSNRKAIFYSLGNFIFDTDYQRSQFNTEFGIILRLKLTEADFSFEPLGIKIDREKGHIIKWDIPEIFENVNEEEYKKLAPLNAKVLIENTKRQLKYLKPDVFNNATEEDFYNNFYEPLRSGRVPGKLLDFQIVYPLSIESEKEEWKKSDLEKVKNYMLKQI